MNEDVRYEEILNKIYENAHMASEAIDMLLPKVENEDLSNELNEEKAEYGKFCDGCIKLLEESGKKPKPQNPLSKLGLWSGIQLNTLTDRSDDKIAEIMIQGNDMGVVDITRLLNEYDNLEEKYKNLAESLVSFEEESTQIMKDFLGKSN
ncbi:MAG: hypothetical protein IJK26_01025 [Clostridia bacterium]|nr:hypothetical protein [Clostridia bacterium]